jgi:hypothetical protein
VSTEYGPQSVWWESGRLPGGGEGFLFLGAAVVGGGADFLEFGRNSTQLNFRKYPAHLDLKKLERELCGYLGDRTQSLDIGYNDVSHRG